MPLERSLCQLRGPVNRLEVALAIPLNDDRSAGDEGHPGATPFVASATGTVDVDEDNVDIPDYVGESVERRAEDPLRRAPGGSVGYRRYATNFYFAHRSLLEKNDHSESANPLSLRFVD